MTTPSGDFDINILAQLASEYNTEELRSFELLRDFIAIIEHMERKKSSQKLSAAEPASADESDNS